MTESPDSSYSQKLKTQVYDWVGKKCLEIRDEKSWFFTDFWEFFKIRSKIFERKLFLLNFSYCSKQEKFLKIFDFQKSKNFLLPGIGKLFEKNFLKRGTPFENFRVNNFSYSSEQEFLMFPKCEKIMEFWAQNEL